MAIPPEFVDEVVARCDIVDLVSDYVKLTPKGGRHWGLCPFHSERTASFQVRPDWQMYHCFGCSKGGGVISFVMEIENLPYPEAIRFLSKRAGLTFPEEGNQRDHRRKERLLRLNQEAARFFHRQLVAPGGERARDYLQRRGLQTGTITRFGLGFAPESWDALLRAMGELGYEKGDMIDVGLAVSGQKGSVYDRFRNRLIFPIIDLRGDVIGFGGRILGEGEPKYLNSSDSLVFQKSRNLFALNFAKTSCFQFLLLTEGYMDTIALHQAGFDNAVASLGTAFTPQHAKLLARFTQEVILAFDSDDAGVAAAKRAIPLLEQAGLKVKVLKLQGAKDPDEYIKKFGSEHFLQLMESSEDHVEYLLAEIERKYNLDDDSERIAFAREAAQSLAVIPSPVEREVYAGRVAAVSGVGKEAILQESARYFKKRRSIEEKKKERKDLLPSQQAQPKARELRYENLRSARAEEGILRLLFLDESLLPETREMNPEYFSSPFLKKIFYIARERWESGRTLTPATLADVLNPEEMAHLTAILEQPVSLHRGGRALRDYWETIKKEQIVHTGEADDDTLRAVQESFLKIKGMGDGKNDR